MLLGRDALFCISCTHFSRNDVIVQWTNDSSIFASQPISSLFRKISQFSHFVCTALRFTYTGRPSPRRVRKHNCALIRAAAQWAHLFDLNFAIASTCAATNACRHANSIHPKRCAAVRHMETKCFVWFWSHLLHTIYDVEQETKRKTRFV